MVSNGEDVQIKKEIEKVSVSHLVGTVNETLYCDSPALGDHDFNCGSSGSHVYINIGLQLISLVRE